MNLSPKYSCGPCFTFIRSICVNSVLECNHYKALGLTPSATQSEIKSAYYELSKKHHPDMNQGSQESAKLFRDIKEAYEVLGNEKSRKQYDREMSYGRSDSSSYSSPDYNDEIERRFYESRKGRMYYGKTPYYDFDAWYKAHYKNKSKNYNYADFYAWYKDNYKGKSKTFTYFYGPLNSNYQNSYSYKYTKKYRYGGYSESEIRKQYILKLSVYNLVALVTILIWIYMYAKMTGKLGTDLK